MRVISSFVVLPVAAWTLLANVFISCSNEERIKRLCRMHSISESETEEMMSKVEKKRAEFYNYYSYKNWGAAETYLLCIDSSVLAVEGTTDFIEEFVKQKLNLR